MHPFDLAEASFAVDVPSFEVVVQDKVSVLEVLEQHILQDPLDHFVVAVVVASFDQLVLAFVQVALVQQNGEEEEEIQVVHSFGPLHEMVVGVAVVALVA